MRFSIGDRAYTVHISPRPIYLDGHECDGRIDPDAGRIMLDGQLPRHDRRRVLLHELRHAWVIEYGRAGDDEADADDAAAFSDWAHGAYQAQGGDRALEAMEPDAAPPSGQLTGAILCSTRICGSCAAPVAVGSIANGEPTWTPALGAWAMSRGMECEACGRVTTWAEVCTEDGMPLGTTLAHPKPRVLTSSEAGRWMRERAAGAGNVV